MIHIAVTALNTILDRWGWMASEKSSPAWNISGEPCSGAAIDDTGINNPAFNPAIKCVCSYDNSTTCHVTELYYSIAWWLLSLFTGLNTLLSWCWHICHVAYDLCRKVYALDVLGRIPDELQNLTYLTNLYVPLSHEIYICQPKSWLNIY